MWVRGGPLILGHANPDVAGCGGEGEAWDELWMTSAAEDFVYELAETDCEALPSITDAVSQPQGRKAMSAVGWRADYEKRGAGI